MQVLTSGEPVAAINHGIRRYDNTMYTYEQERTGVSWFYCKRQVLEDGVHTVPLDITLSPWDQRDVMVVGEDHEWSLSAPRELIVDGLHFETLAEACVYASTLKDPLKFMGMVLPQLPAVALLRDTEVII